MGMITDDGRCKHEICTSPPYYQVVGFCEDCDSVFGPADLIDIIDDLQRELEQARQEIDRLLKIDRMVRKEQAARPFSHENRQIERGSSGGGGK